MASIKGPRASGADCPNAPSVAAIRTSESLCEQDEPRQAKPLPRAVKQTAVDFSQLQARYG